jgi:hypothetical protein
MGFSYLVAVVGQVEYVFSSGKEISLPGIGHCFLSTPILDKQLSFLLLFTEKKGEERKLEESKFRSERME